MQEVFKKIKEQLEEERKRIVAWDSDNHYIYKEGVDWMGNKAIEIVNQVAEEYNQSLANNNQSLTNGDWIPCSEKKPEFKIYTLTPIWVTMRKKGGTYYFVTRLKWNGYLGRLEWNNGKMISDTWEVIAWQKIKYPKPYKPEGE